MPANTFEDILKFNPYHDRLGRFTTAGAETSFTYAPGKSKAHDNAIERHKQRMASIAPSEAQEKTLKAIESKTRNLKKEQFRVVDRDGNVVMQKQGEEHSVSYKIGEARDNFPGNITIHNHPSGGPFSTADLSDFGYGATEIRAAAQEGTYIMRNLSYKGKYVSGKKSWVDMRDDLDAAAENFKSSRQLKSELRAPYDQKVQPLVDQWAKRKAEGAPKEELDAIAKKYNDTWDELQPQLEKAAWDAYVGQYHHWYKAHAGEYGMEYEFVPVKSRTKKSYPLDESIEKSAGEIVLDRKMKEDVDEIVNDVLSEYQLPVEKEFSIFKTDEDKRLVFGWASISLTVDGEQLKDRQEDMIDPEDLEEAAYEYVLNFRDTGEEHIPTMRKKGKLVESCVLTAEKQKAMGIPEGTVPVGWWIGFKITDDDAWNRVKSGHYKMFSIEGQANRLPVEKADSVAKSFEDVLKFNDRHDPKTGRFAPKNGGYTAMSGAEMAKNGVLDDSSYFGVRTLAPDEKYEVGDECRESYDWDHESDRSTYETDNPITLDGTCTIGIKSDPTWDEPEDFELALNDALKLSQGYFGDRRVLVGGAWGNGGEDEGELIIGGPGGAKVLAIYDSKSGKWLTKPPAPKKEEAPAKPKLSNEDVERYKQKFVEEFIESHPGTNRHLAFANLPFEQRKKITALQNYALSGDEKFLDGIDISDVIVAKSFSDVLKSHEIRI